MIYTPVLRFIAMQPNLLVLHVLTYSLATRTVWNTIDNRYSSFALYTCRNVAKFVGFACFDIFSCHYDSVEYYR